MGKSSREHSKKRKQNGTTVAADSASITAVNLTCAKDPLLTNHTIETPSPRELPTAADSDFKLKIQEALNLPQRYQERKASQAGFLSFFAPANPERLEKITFITLIASNITDQQPAAEIIDGAYIYVMQEIENAYHQAWWSRDPKASQLHAELSDRTSGKTADEKLLCLNQLKINLQDEGIQKKIQLGDEKISEILTKIDRQTRVLSEVAQAMMLN